MRFLPSPGGGKRPRPGRPGPDRPLRRFYPDITPFFIRTSHYSIFFPQAPEKLPGIPPHRPAKTGEGKRGNFGEKAALPGKFRRKSAENGRNFSRDFRGGKAPRGGCPGALSMQFGIPGGNHFTILAISSAKFSCFVSMPSPFSKRTALTKVTLPPSFLAASAI